LLVERLINTFPAFKDQAIYKGKEIFILKKAQLLAADLYRRFKDSHPDKFNFSDVDNLTVFSDNVLPAVLRKYGILELSTDLKEHIDNKIDLPRSDNEVELRVQAIVASDMIIKRAKTMSKFSSMHINSLVLDYYLWTKGKDPEFRSVERHYTKDTIYY